jgi:hypothetical protein
MEIVWRAKIYCNGELMRDLYEESSKELKDYLEEFHELSSYTKHDQGTPWLPKRPGWYSKEDRAGSWHIRVSRIEQIFLED